MSAKLRLDLDGLCVETFAAQEAPIEGGTVHANEDAATNNVSCRTFCFTTPCCPDSVTCPTA